MPQLSNVYLIKDLARLSGHSIHTIKFYLKSGIIKESGRSPETRFRYFDDETLKQLSSIRMWRKQRKSLAEIRRLLAAEISLREISQQGTTARPEQIQPEGHGHALPSATLGTAHGRSRRTWRGMAGDTASAARTDKIPRPRPGYFKQVG